MLETTLLLRPQIREILLQESNHASLATDSLSLGLVWWEIDEEKRSVIEKVGVCGRDDG